jgi:hypothetical protein
VGFRQRLIAIKIWLVKYGRQWRWVGFPSFNDLAFVNRCHFLNFAKNVGPAEILLKLSFGALGTDG